MPPKEDSPLESLKERLYQPPTKTGVDIPGYTPEQTPAPYGWQAPPPIAPKKRTPWTVWFLAGAGTFLVIAALVAAFLVFRGVRSISSDRVTITADAPVSIASGDTVSMVLTVHNGNPATLTNATILATFPDGTKAVDGTDMAPYSDVLGDIPAGGDVTRTVQVKLYGAESQSLTIPVKVQFKTQGSSALLQSEKDVSITVATSPITVQVQTLSQTPSGQPLMLSVLVRSNASTPIDHVALTAQYPSGFSVRSSTPTATAANYFDIGTLSPGDQKTIQIRGVLIGQNAEQKTFQFSAGSANRNGTDTLGDTFAQAQATITITHPFLNVGLSLNQESADTVTVIPGKVIGGQVTWQNTLADTLANASIKVGIAGNALAPGSISGGTGFYRSQDSTVIFDSTTDKGLASLASNDTGSGSFSFAIKSPQALVGVKNPTVTLTVSTTGLQSNQGASPQSLSATLTRTIKVGTQVALTTSTARVAGPVPPVVGSETTYAITLTAANTVNSVGAAKVTFTLPSYVKFVSAGTGITFNPDTHTVTWMIGDINPGSKSTGSLQVSITPSASQHDTVPLLTSDMSFSGVDRFTQEQVTSTAAGVTTELPGSTSSGTVN